jgi:hypothetical protein
VSLLDILEGNYGCERSRYFRVVYKSVDLSSRAVYGVCHGCSLAGIVGSNPAGGVDICLLMSAVCFQVEVSASANYSSRGVPPSLVCLGGIVKPQ